MASNMEAGAEHATRAAQNAPDSVIFPTPPPALCAPVGPFPQLRARADSQSHFRLRPALTALQNTFISRRRASSVSDAASQNSDSAARSSHLVRFVGLGMEPRPRTNSSATVVPPHVKRCPSALDFAILESPDEAMSRAPRIPSFHMDSEFGRDLGLSLGLNPRFSAASTVRAQSLSLAPEESRVVKDLFAQNHLDQHRAEGADEALVPLSGGGSAQDMRAAWSAPAHIHARDADLLTQLAGTVASAPVPTANTASTSPLVIDAAIRPVAEEIVVAAETGVHPHPAAELAHTTSHAQCENDSYFGSARVVGGVLPTSPVVTPAASGASSPTALRSPLLSPVRSTVARSTTVSPVRSITVVSPKQSVAMGTAPSSPVYPPTSSLAVPTIPTSPSYTAAIPFPSAEDNESFVSDDASGFVSQYAYSHQSGYDTPALYTGTTNTSPTLSVTRVVSGEVPSTLRLGPGMGFMGVGTYVGGAVQGGVFLGVGDGTSSGLLSPGRPRTVDSGVSGFGRGEFDKDGDSLLPESCNRSTNAESSGRSTHAESSRSGHAESSSATGIRARVSSLRTHQTLSALIPAFMKRARRKSKMAREDVEEVEKPRGRKDKKGKQGERELRDSQSRAGTESSRVRTESSRPRTDSAASSCPVSDDEEDVSPASSDLDLLSSDPFASTVALKVGAWSEMYAGVGSYGCRKSSNVPARDSRSPNTFSDQLPPIVGSTADYHSDANMDRSSSLYDDESEEESSIRIYSHGRGRSLSQPDVYTIPIEPLHQSNATKRSGSSLGGRRKRIGLPSRPSLPTLSTLTRTNVIIPMPRTTAAARFPAEPWDDIGRGAQETGVPSLGTRGLGSLVLPVPGSPVRGSMAFPRSPMRSRMGSVVGMGSESSIAEDEDEYEDEEPAGSSKGAPSVVGDGVWWSGSSSRLSSRRSSFRSSAAEDDEAEEVTVSMAILNEVAVRDSVASTARLRDSATASDRSDRLSQGSVDVSSDAFLQKLDQLDASAPTTPPPSDRSSSELWSDRSAEALEMPTGVGPRNLASDAGGLNGGGASTSGFQKQGGANGWKSGAGGAGSNGGSNAPRRQAPADTESDESSAESSSDEPFARRGRDARGPSTMAARSRSMPRQPVSIAKVANRPPGPANGSSDESDDVPLAQRIPTALRAQKSIRVQDKAEREERRQKRLERMRHRTEQGAATSGEGGIAPDELAKRLLNVQVGGRESSRSPLPSPRSPMPFGRVPDSATSGLFPMSDARSRTMSNVSHMTRSRTHTRNPSAEQPQAPPPPAIPQVSISRSGTMSKQKPSAPEAPMPVPRTSLSRSGTMSKSRPSQEEPRTSLSRSGTAYRNRGGSKTDDEGESSRFQRSRSIRDPGSARPPMPPMPPIESIPMSARRPSQQESTAAPLVVEQRIYIGDRQKFIVIDVGSPGLTAKDVIDVAKQRGELDVPGTGGWQLWEQSNECGMERPVRDFEFVNDVLKAWNPEKRVNVLIIRRSQLCGLLKPENIPSSSPTMSGWVMWAAKPGKWSKRWLELKEHSLFVCKSDKGKDQTFLCGVSNFDAYIVTHIQRAPKGFVFAAKSTESSGLFEKEEDSSRIFSCDRDMGEVWLNKILLARPRPFKVATITIWYQKIDCII
ncbi:hypothetical protein FRC10_006888 [Ceratobasidium sp. 414]|nr:hypothetical protein FRC10_006888 [Ceratobasidium sp. 414]